MNKKKIISTTIMFLLIVASIVLFKMFFGEINALVAVTGVTAALSLLESDYTINPTQNTIYFVCLEVILGIAAFLAELNALSGLIITFCMVFYILYHFTYEHKKPTYVGFTLGYFFMLYSPITLQELPLRLFGLAICGLAIMGLQFLFNRNLIQKVTHTQSTSALRAVIEELSLMESKSGVETITSLNHSAHTTLRTLIERLYEYIDKGAKLPRFLFQQLFIAHFLEQLNIQIKELLEHDAFSKIRNLKALSTLLHHIECFLDDKENIDNLLYAIDNFLSASHFIPSKSYFDFEITASASILKKDLILTTADDLSKLYQQYFITHPIDHLTSFKNNIRKDSLRFTFAFRGALITSLGVFIVSAFDIQSGKWIIFSLHAIVQPYLDYSKTKGHQRLTGTVIGLIIFEIAFSIFTTTSARMILILLAGYISNYQTNYRSQVICITISALGAASIGANIGLIGFERLIYVAIGTLVALYANKIILPYRMSDATKADLDHSIDIDEQITSVLCQKVLEPKLSNKELNTLLHINRFINKKIEYNNQLLASDAIHDYIYNQHIFMADVRTLSNLFASVPKEETTLLKLRHAINDLKNTTLSKKESLKYINELDDILNQSILLHILKIKQTIDDSKTIVQLIIKSL